MGSVDGATATTDAQGRYRAGLVKPPWSAGPIPRARLCTWLQSIDRKINVGTGTASAKFELVADPWQETEIRMQDNRC
jgi:hypothetical protein